MHDPFVDIGGHRVRRRAAGFEAAALVDRDVDESPSRASSPRTSARLTSLGAAAPGPARRDHEVGRGHLALDVLHRREESVELGAELHVELVEAGSDLSMTVT